MAPEPCLVAANANNSQAVTQQQQLSPQASSSSTALTSFTVRRQEGDGNCLFRSFSDQLYGSPDYHALLRDKCATYIASEKNYFAQFVSEPFDKFLARIQQAGECGDDIEIEALSEIYDCRIEIYDSYTHSLMRTFHEACAAQWPQPIRLLYEGRAHYNSLAPLSGLVPAINAMRMRPGEIEDVAILRSKRRQEAGKGRLGAAETDSDQTDQVLIDRALEDSRVKFEHKSEADMDFALEDSRTLFLDKQVADREMKDSHDEWEKLEQSHIEEEMMNSIMQESGAGNIHESASGSAEFQYPESVYNVMSLGIPLEDCIKAYHLVGDDPESILALCCQNLR